MTAGELLAGSAVMAAELLSGVVRLMAGALFAGMVQ